MARLWLKPSFCLWIFFKSSSSTQLRWRFVETFPSAINYTIPTRETSKRMQSELQALQRCFRSSTHARWPSPNLPHSLFEFKRININLSQTCRAWSPPTGSVHPASEVVRDRAARGINAGSLCWLTPVFIDKKRFLISRAELQQQHAVLGCHSNALMIKENRCVV